MPSTLRPDGARDLVLDRVVDVPRELVWRAWTVPEHVKRWFTPRRGQRSNARSTCVPAACSGR